MCVLRDGPVDGGSAYRIYGSSLKVGHTDTEGRGESGKATFLPSNDGTTMAKSERRQAAGRRKEDDIRLMLRTLLTLIEENTVRIKRLEDVFAMNIVKHNTEAIEDLRRRLRE